MTVFRIHIRPKGGAADTVKSFEYCWKNKVLGLGWQINNPSEKMSWDEYKAEAVKKGYSEKELSRVKYLKDKVKQNDLIWTRDTEGNYYLGKVQSEWEYYSNEEARKADIVNVVCCDLQKIHCIDDVPGKVIACFRPTRAIQSIKDNTAASYSEYLWNKLSGTNDYEVQKVNFTNVFSLINSEETEDVIFIYLQVQGWIVIPNSRKADTMSYEFLLIHKDTKEKAIVQVKTGDTPLNSKNPKWQDKAEKVFLFQANGKYANQSSNNVVCLLPAEIETFMKDNSALLPASISYWLEIANKN